jgi:hypothetical protein
VNQKTQVPNVFSAMLVLASLALGYGFVSSSLVSPRPSPLEAAAHFAGTGQAHKVESRLWQDPFEAFEPSTNQASAKAEAGNRDSGSWLSARGSVASLSYKLDFGSPPSNSNTDDPWDQIRERATSWTAVFGVMLPGGPYAEDKEVRLRLRYAVELALLTGELGPEDRNHISTNAVRLSSDSNAPPSRLSYEWFRSRSDKATCRACVLWLNEDDFTDNPGRRLDALLCHSVDSLADTNKKVTFYLIGPRTSDTLRNLAVIPFNGATSLVAAARAGRFQILSPEATASVHDTINDEYGKKLEQELDDKFGSNKVFHNWVATDQRLAKLIARELKNRLRGSLSGPSNIVVILSEQDTYFGSRAADEWIDALVTNQVCARGSDVWQFAYLKGLDGSKPPKEPASSQPAGTGSGAEGTPEVGDQQQKGQKADGDAQMDYITRLGYLLGRKDRERKNERRGRIVAVGLTGSDAYDKLILLRAMSRRLPEAVFFTTDLEAPLWTANVLPYSRNLLVASACPLEPDTLKNDYPALEEFPTFRDVYQTAVFHACNAVVTNLWLRCDNPTNDTNYELKDSNLDGFLFKIGRHGPVQLDAAEASRRNWLAPAIGLLALSALLTILAASAGSGIDMSGRVVRLLKFCVSFASSSERRLQKKSAPDAPWPAAPPIKQHEAQAKPQAIQAQEKKARGRQMAPFQCGLWIVLTGIVAAVFVGLAHWIAQQPGEEPWDFSGGVTIWPSQCLRALAVFGGLVFLLRFRLRLIGHRGKLWKNFFYQDGVDWDSFWEQCRGKGMNALRPGSEHEWRLWWPAGWVPEFKEMDRDGEPEVGVDALGLFRQYLHFGRFGFRLLRAGLHAVIYAVLAGSLIFWLRDIPTWLLVRGPWSHLCDRYVLAAAVFVTLLALFFVMDAALLTNRILDCISQHPTLWPADPLRDIARKRSVKEEHLDGFLDVQFTAIQTEELGSRMFGPVLLLLLLIFSRLPFFDNWTWPPGLILIFAMNFVLATVCWWVVRRAAGQVRKLALERINDAISSVKSSQDPSVTINFSGQPALPVTLPTKKYLRNLKAVHQAISEENRGAYARWFQDPTYLAVFIPSGISGIVSVIASLPSWWTNK